MKCSRKNLGVCVQQTAFYSFFLSLVYVDKMCIYFQTNVNASEVINSNLKTMHLHANPQCDSLAHICCSQLTCIGTLQPETDWCDFDGTMELLFTSQ